MLDTKQPFRSLLMVASLATSVLLTGCAARVGVGYRAYDPYYHDRHIWDDREIQFYNQWSDETHRDRHREFRKLKKHEQAEYFNWRHNRPDKH
jgi:hypothetical protein